MAGIIYHTFILGCIALVFLVCPFVCTASLLCQKECNCSTSALSDANKLQENCICPEYGIIPHYVLQNVDKLDLGYSKPVILSSGNFQRFRQIQFLNISGLQFVEPGGFQGLETLHRLVLYDNYMRVLETNMFYDLGNLLWLTVEGTTKHKIHALENGTFCILTKLKCLKMKANAITDIMKEHFRDLETLNIIDLSDNRLTQIKAETFIYAPLLTEIYLSKNLITEIHQRAFNGLTRLDKLALDGNRIKGMPQPVFSPGSLGGSNVLHMNILLDNNPLRCDCHLNWISSWVDGHDCEGRCLTPSKFSNKYLWQVYKDGLPQCQPNNTIRSVEPGKQLALTCPFAGASWVTPDGRSFQEHGDCEDPFYLTNSDSLIIWKTTPELSGNYTCLSSDGTQAFFYQVDVNEASPLLTVAIIAGIVAGGFLLIVLIIVTGCKLLKNPPPGNPPPGNPPPENPPPENPPPGNPPPENPPPENPPPGNPPAEHGNGVDGERVFLLQGARAGDAKYQNQAINYKINSSSKIIKYNIFNSKSA